MIPIKPPDSSGLSGQGFVSRPHIFAKALPASQRRPVQPLDVDVSYVKDSLAGATDGRIIMVTKCLFGWSKLYVDCVCVLINAQEVQETLLEKVRAQQTPTIIMTGEIVDL